MKSQYGRTKSVRSQQYRSLNCSNKKLTNQTQSQKFKRKFMKSRTEPDFRLKGGKTYVKKILDL